MKFLTLMMIFILSGLSHAGFIPNTIQGEIKDIFVGELDPFVGDYCVITIRDKASGNLYGLVSDEGPSGVICDDADTAEKGWLVAARGFHGALIDDSDLIGALHQYSKFVFKKERVFFIRYDENLRYLDLNY